MRQFQQAVAALPFAHDIGLLVIRLTVGLVFAAHGAQKLFGVLGGRGISGTATFMDGMGLPLPLVSAILAGSAEFFGGLAFVTGIGIQLLSIPLAFTMLVAVIVTTDQGFLGGYELPLVLGFVVLGMGLVGPGRFALASGRRR
jgi:putative oxidoreductase